MQQLFQRARERMGPQDYQPLKALFESHAYVAELVRQEDMAIDQLSRMLYGRGSEQLAAVVPDGTTLDTGSMPCRQQIDG